MAHELTMIGRSQADTPSKPARPVVDALIVDMWDICLAQDEDTEVIIKAHHDQWWGIRATCSHGTWQGVSNGTTDFTAGFQDLHRKFVDGHRTN